MSCKCAYNARAGEVVAFEAFVETVRDGQAAALLETGSPTPERPGVLREPVGR
jgi:hypothetical protein